MQPKAGGAWDGGRARARAELLIMTRHGSRARWGSMVIVRMPRRAAQLFKLFHPHGRASRKRRPAGRLRNSSPLCRFHFPFGASLCGRQTAIPHRADFQNGCRRREIAALSGSGPTHRLPNLCASTARRGASAESFFPAFRAAVRGCCFILKAGV